MCDRWGTGKAGLVRRMIGAVILDGGTYRAVQADRDATVQAGTVVVLSSMAAGIGEVPLGLDDMGWMALSSLVNWLVWTGITYFVGNMLLGGTATWGALLRTLGFAMAPGILAALVVVPLVGGLIRAAVAPWLLVAGVVAIRQALDFSTGKAILTGLLGLIPYWIARALLF